MADKIRLIELIRDIMYGNIDNKPEIDNNTMNDPLNPFEDIKLMILKLLYHDTFIESDVRYIYNFFNKNRFNINAMLNIDLVLFENINNLKNLQETDENKKLLDNLHINLKALQISLLLSTINNEINEPMYRLINLLNNKIATLNKIIINRRESEPLKATMQNIWNNNNAQNNGSPADGNALGQGGGNAYHKYLKYKTKYSNIKKQKKNKRL
ncbi:hypothetical protein Hokovirus_1_60 [Hokovirus HKV1]|uniref:Uncharacterized protein n=1 Tax=Hokovirus HKV1 TaxID=1977638 RepID=A0A1V0SES9_9VIRU|nr:hypothetical protein Hokovirus_1_60 [Hokovirus HKV1]